MAKAPKKPPADEDETQSRRFMDTVRDLEAAGELSVTDGESAFERLARKVMPPRTGVKPSD